MQRKLSQSITNAKRISKLKSTAKLPALESSPGTPNPKLRRVSVKAEIKLPGDEESTERGFNIDLPNTVTTAGQFNTYIVQQILEWLALYYDVSIGGASGAKAIEALEIDEVEDI